MDFAVHQHLFHYGEGLGKKKNEDKLSTQQVWSCLLVLRLSEAVKFFMGELEFEWGTSCRYVHLVNASICLSDFLRR